MSIETENSKNQVEAEMTKKTKMIKIDDDF